MVGSHDPRVIKLLLKLMVENPTDNFGYIVQIIEKIDGGLLDEIRQKMDGNFLVSQRGIPISSDPVLTDFLQEAESHTPLTTQAPKPPIHAIVNQQQPQPVPIPQFHPHPPQPVFFP